MEMPRRRQGTRGVARAIVATICACATLLLMTQLPARALEVTDISTPVTGNATHFDGLGSPYGGCGLPQTAIDSQDFVALNVYNTPGDYSFYPRPLTGSDLSKLGLWNNGLNCGRWVQVSIGDYCTGTNDGAPSQAFCRNGSWVADSFNGATLNMVVADSCGDSNAWCRDDPYHLDLATDSLARFTLNGSLTTGLPNKWNNRHISWKFITAPNYSGDINIGFLQGSQAWWTAVAVSHLANGVHSIDYYTNGAWVPAAMDSDMGQAYLISPLTAGGTSYQIRVRDVNDQLINGGEVYSFSLPSSCGSQCSPAYTAATYTTSGGTTTTTSPVTTTTTTTRPVTTTTTTTTRPVTTTTTTTTRPVTTTTTRPVTTTTTTTRPVTTTTTTRPVTTTTTTRTTTTTDTRDTYTTTTSGGTGKTCSAAYAVTGQWTGGFQGNVTVTAGSSAITGWKVAWTFANGQTVSKSWSANLTSSGSAVTATNLSWNGILGAGANTSFGFLGSWNGTNTVPTVTCTAS